MGASLDTGLDEWDTMGQERSHGREDNLGSGGHGLEC